MQSSKEYQGDKKAFLSDQCKEIEGNNRMGKSRDLFRKVRDTKGTFHAKMGLIKDRNGMDITEGGDIKKRWQEYTEQLYKKDLHDLEWPKYWSFSFNISPSNERPRLISFRMDWLDLLAVQGTLKSLLQHHSSKTLMLWCSAFFIVQLSHPYLTTGKTIALLYRTLSAK